MIGCARRVGRPPSESRIVWKFFMLVELLVPNTLLTTTPVAARKRSKNSQILQPGRFIGDVSESCTFTLSKYYLYITP